MRMSGLILRSRPPPKNTAVSTRETAAAPGPSASSGARSLMSPRKSIRHRPTRAVIPNASDTRWVHAGNPQLGADGRGSLLPLGPRVDLHGRPLPRSQVRRGEVRLKAVYWNADPDRGVDVEGPFAFEVPKVDEIEGTLSGDPCGTPAL